MTEIAVPISRTLMLQIGAFLLSVALVLIILTAAGYLKTPHSLRVGLGLTLFAGLAFIYIHIPDILILYGYIAAAITMLASVGVTLAVIRRLATRDHV